MKNLRLLHPCRIKRTRHHNRERLRLTRSKLNTISHRERTIRESNISTLNSRIREREPSRNRRSIHNSSRLTSKHTGIRHRHRVGRRPLTVHSVSFARSFFLHRELRRLLHRRAGRVVALAVRITSHGDPIGKALTVRNTFLAGAVKNLRLLHPCRIKRTRHHNRERLRLTRSKLNTISHRERAVRQRGVLTVNLRSRDSETSRNRRRIRHSLRGALHLASVRHRYLVGRGPLAVRGRRLSRGLLLHRKLRGLLHRITRCVVRSAVGVAIHRDRIDKTTRNGTAASSLTLRHRRPINVSRFIVTGDLNLEGLRPTRRKLHTISHRERTRLSINRRPINLGPRECEPLRKRRRIRH